MGSLLGVEASEGAQLKKKIQKNQKISITEEKNKDALWTKNPQKKTWKKIRTQITDSFAT